MTPAGLLTAKDVAEYLQVSESTVKALARSGRLRGYRIGKLWRFDREAVEDCLSAQETQSAVMPATPPVLVMDPTEYPAGFTPVDFAAIRERGASR